MSDEKQSNFREDIELAKLNIVAEEWRGSFLIKVGTLLSALVAISAVILSAQYAKQLDWTISVIAIIVVGIFILWRIRSTERVYRKKIERLDVLVRKVYTDESIGNLSELLKEKY